MYVYMYVCIYIYILLYVYVCVYICIHIMYIRATAGELGHLHPRGLRHLLRRPALQHSGISKRGFCRYSSFVMAWYFGSMSWRQVLNHRRGLVGSGTVRGWRNTVGNLIEIVWLKNLSRGSIYWHMRETQRVMFHRICQHSLL